MGRVRKPSPCQRARGPVCIGCGKGRCRRWFGTVPQKMGWRIVDGKAWCWYCSLTCSTRAMGQANAKNPKFQNACAANRRKAARLALRRLIDVARPHLTQDGLVPLKVFGELYMRERRREYQKGWTAAMRQCGRYGSKDNAA